MAADPVDIGAAGGSGIRLVDRVVEGIATLEGEGFLVHRPFPSRDLPQFDPFLLLDEMGPMDLGPGEAKGAPDHPHRGFETVTYMLSGSFEHKDSHGHSGKLSPGDVQWMTAGGGVIHSEQPSAEFRRQGGLLHGVQLWVNLPRKDKMMRPRYQEIPAPLIPTARSADGRVSVRVLAGEALGAKAVIDTRIPILYLHFEIQPGASIEQAVPRSYNVLAYVLSGVGRFGGQAESLIARGHMVQLASGGDTVLLEAPSGMSEPLSVLLIGGQPIHEPVVRYGPFVMNTKEEISQAIEDYQSGRMGTIDF
jgi:redox-sensitive bicupin YhaK (pirin superfamily)